MSESNPLETQSEFVKESCRDEHIPTWGTVRVCEWHRYVVIIQRNGWCTVYEIKDRPVMVAYIKSRHIELNWERGTIEITARDLEPYKWILENPVVIFEGRSAWVILMA